MSERRSATDPIFDEGWLHQAVREEGWAVSDGQITDLYRRMVDLGMLQLDKGDYVVEEWLDEVRNEAREKSAGVSTDLDAALELLNKAAAALEEVGT